MGVVDKTRKSRTVGERNSFALQVGSVVQFYPDFGGQRVPLKPLLTRWPASRSSLFKLGKGVFLLPRFHEVDQSQSHMEPKFLMTFLGHKHSTKATTTLHAAGRHAPRKRTPPCDIYQRGLYMFKLLTLS